MLGFFGKSRRPSNADLAKLRAEHRAAQRAESAPTLRSEHAANAALHETVVAENAERARIAAVLGPKTPAAKGRTFNPSPNA